MDPRVTTPALGLAQQFTLSKQLYDGIIDAQKALDETQAPGGQDCQTSERSSRSRESSPRSKARPAAAAAARPTVPTR